MMLICAAFTNVKAQTVTWIGGTGNWNVPANWDLNFIPGSGNDVIIPTGSNVSINTAANVRSITVNGNAMINISAGLTFTNASTFGSNVTSTWTANGLNGGGTLTNLGTMNLSSTSNKSLGTGTTLNNGGTINLSGTGNLYLTNSTINNQASGIFNLLTAAGNITFSGSTTELFINSGTLNGNTSTGTVSIDCTMTNSGTINVISGQLSLTDSSNQFNGGTYNVAAATTLLCSGTTTLSGTLTGLLEGAFNWAGTFSVPAAATLNFTGTAGLNWNSGTLNGSGTLTQMSILNLLTSSNKSMGSSTTLNNTGTINIASAGNLYLTNSTVNNQAMGTINMMATAGHISFSGSTTEMLNNYGTINRSGAAGAAAIYATMNNSGTINVTAGTLEINDSLSQLNGGVYNVSAGTTLLWSSTLTCSGNFTGVINGTLDWSGTLTIPAAASFNFSGPSGVSWNSGALNGGGILTNNSIINLVSASNKSMGSGTTLNNMATVSIMSAGNLFLTNATFNNQLTGILNLMVAAGHISFSASTTEMLNNFGTINRSGATGVVTISATMNNTGTINVTVGTLEISDTLSQLNGGIYNVSAGATLLWSSTLTCTGSMTGTIDGTLNWSGIIIVPTAATFNFSSPSVVSWTTGALNGSGILTNNSTINLVSASNKSIGSGTTLNNAGTFSILSSGNLYFTNCTFNNQISGILNLMAAAGHISFSSSATEMLNNLGTINRNGESGTAVIYATMNNTGTINVTSGTLDISDALTKFSGGIYNVSAGSTLLLSQTVTCSGTLTGTLDGPMVWTATISVLPINPATFNFTGSDNVKWQSGILSGAGVLTNQGKLLLTTGSNKSISGTTLDNEGMMTLESTGNVYLSNATINNRASGVLNLSSNAAGLSFSSSSLHIINNYGLFTKNIENGTTSIGVDVNNYGFIDAILGTMQFNGTLNNTVLGTVKGIATVDLPPASDLTNDGTFAPGGNPGKLIVIGNFETAASSKLMVDLNGLTQITQYDLMEIQGNAFFYGIVEISLQFDANVNDEFIIATTSGTITAFGMATSAVAQYEGLEYTFDVLTRNDNQLVLKVANKVLRSGTFSALDQNIILAPNPAKETFVLRNDTNQQLLRAEIIDLSGRIIRTIDLHEMKADRKIDVDNCASGQYLMKLYTNDATVIKRFILQ